MPAIVDGDLRLYESTAIVDSTWKTPTRITASGSSPARCATARSCGAWCAEADSYFVPPMNRLVQRVLFTKQDEWDAERIAAARDEVAQELGERWVQALRGDYLAGPLSAADFALYPLLRSRSVASGRNPTSHCASGSRRGSTRMQGVEILRLLPQDLAGALEVSRAPDFERKLCAPDDLAARLGASPGRSSSPTACSTSFIAATSPTSRRRALARAWWWA